jgi:SAM-dependent methyltransferase
MHGKDTRPDRIRRHYEHRIQPQRPNYDVLDWASEGTQHARFEVLAGAVDLEGKRLLDVGCGLGDLLGFIQRRGLSVDYTGVDLLDRMVQAARVQHPRGAFVAADIFSASPFEPASFDVVFCSGALNLNLGNNRQFLPWALERLFELSRKWVVFNLLHARFKHDDPSYFHYEPNDVLEVLSRFNCSVRLIDDYLPNDFTCVCTIRTGA